MVIFGSSLHIKMLYCCVIVEKYMVCKSLFNPSPQTLNLQQTIFKSFTQTNGKFLSMKVLLLLLLLDSVENILTKREMAHDEQFLLLSECC